jgi:hypothetical protein
MKVSPDEVNNRMLTLSSKASLPQAGMWPIEQPATPMLKHYLLSPNPVNPVRLRKYGREEAFGQIFEGPHYRSDDSLTGASFRITVQTCPDLVAPKG